MNVRGTVLVGWSLVVLGACRDPKERAPWDTLEPLSHDPLRELMSRELEDAVAPRQIEVAQSTTFVLDQGQVHVLDARYRHAPLVHCVALDRWSDMIDDPDRRGPCDEGEVALRPGEITLQEGVAAVAPLPAGLLLLDTAGEIFTTNVDPRVGDPLDLYRPLPLLTLAGGEAQRDVVRLLATETAAGTEVVLVEQDRIRRWDPSGGLSVSEELPASARVVDAAMIGGELWLATTTGLRAGTQTVDVVGLRLVPDGVGGAWVVSPPEGLVHVAADRTMETVPVTGLTGPIARWNEQIYLAVEGGLVRLSAGVETARIDEAEIQDLSVGAPGELRVLRKDGTISVRFDDDRLSGGPPLHVFISSFYENPKNAAAEENTPCLGGDSIDAHLEIAAENIDFLDDLPVITSVGITAPAARRTDSCLRLGDLEDLLHNPQLEPALFIHESPQDCSTNDCYRVFLEDQLALIQDMGFSTPLVTGMSEHTELGLDWADVFSLLDVPPRFTFFGMSAYDDIPLADPRGKDPFVVRGLTPSRAWRVASAYGDVAVDDPAGTVTMYPGDNIPGFFFGDCPNLTVDECNALNMGGGATFDADDTEVMELLVTRALAQRDEEGVHTWTFHLPALEMYPYTEDCSESGRVWSGETCEAARLQAWFFGLHQRWALSGEIRWARVGEIPTL